jgi:predicted nucleic acid binding AN1-type Zn finger protein
MVFIMGSVIDLYERKNNDFTKIPACSIPGCTNQPANQCNICSNHFCYEHIKSHIHPSEFPHMQQ